MSDPAVGSGVHDRLIAPGHHHQREEAAEHDHGIEQDEGRDQDEERPSIPSGALLEEGADAQQQLAPDPDPAPAELSSV
jgi:hypothetical protein